MNSFLTRLNGVFSFTLSALAVVTVLCFLSTAFKDRHVTKSEVETSPTYTIKVKEIFNRYTRTQNDHIDLKLKIDANFTEIFNWNVREIFVFVVASYKTRRHVVNEVVLWDKIIRRGDPSVINLPSTVVEYHLLDHGKGLIGNDNMTLRLCWNVIPIAGQLPLIRAAPSHVIIPSVYS